MIQEFCIWIQTHAPVVPGYMHTDVYNSIIYENQKMETTQHLSMLVDESVVIILSCKESQQAVAIQSNMDEPHN